MIVVGGEAHLFDVQLRLTRPEQSFDLGVIKLADESSINPLSPSQVEVSEESSAAQIVIQQTICARRLQVLLRAHACKKRETNVKEHEVICKGRHAYHQKKNLPIR